ncbi:MAG: sigma-70 family RNA polymerase sigma factor [Ruminococcaceae bacterium]|nr:sigma-70 family RNA polymerase sigma factor [Oscillospiraceae bacterium]
MAIEKSVKEEYLNLLTQKYMDMLFYFSLKKTGDSFEAENLAQDILLNIITSLEKGNEPINFEAWVWGIARNRYSVWAKVKHNRNEFFVSPDPGDHGISDETANTENKVIDSEDLNLLRRELAFVSSEYRNIVVAYYIEDRKIRDIAVSLGLPESTVKSKLFRARKILKEGMNMSREFGLRSYKPGDVVFAASGSQPSGLPWKAVRRSLPKNILLELDNNPLTIEQLAIECGVAMPYIEDEVELLLDATLLKKVGNKYVTNIFIAGKECQYEIWMAQRERSKERSQMIDTVVTDSIAGFREAGIVKNNMSDNDLKWWAVIFAVDCFVKSLDGYDIYYPEKRSNGEAWGFIGYELYDEPEKTSMGHNGSGDGTAMFWTYKIGDDSLNLWDRAGEMGYTHARFFADVLKNNRNYSEFSENERAAWKDIENRFAHLDEDGNIVSDILVLAGDAKQKCVEILQSHPLATELKANFKSAYDDTVKILKRYSHPVLEKQLTYCASMIILNTRMMTVHDEILANRLTVPEKPDESTIAMWIEYK